MHPASAGGVRPVLPLATVCFRDGWTQKEVTEHIANLVESRGPRLLQYRSALFPAELRRLDAKRVVLQAPLATGLGLQTQDFPARGTSCLSSDSTSGRSCSLVSACSRHLARQCDSVYAAGFQR